MNLRWAMLFGAGVVFTLGIGGLAVSLGLTVPAAVNAADVLRPESVVYGILTAKTAERLGPSMGPCYNSRR